MKKSARVAAFVAGGLAIASGGCNRPLPEGAYVCEARAECPPAWFCRADRRCWITPDDAGGPEDAGDAGLASDATFDGDAPRSDSGAGPAVTVVTRRALVAVPDLEVIFHDGAGEVLEVRMTDATGRAVSTMPGVAAVTLVRGDSDLANLSTVYGLSMPDTVTFDLPPMEPQTLRQVVLPGAFAGATFYAAVGPCNAYVDPDPASNFEVCDEPGESNIAAYALNDGPLPLAFALRFGGPDEAIVTLSEWRTDFVETPTTVSGGAASATIFTRALAGYTLQLGTMEGRDGTLRRLPELPRPPIRIEAHGVSTIATGAIDRSASVVYTTSLPATLAIDLDEAPDVSSYAADRSDPAHPRLSWVSSGAAPAWIAARFVYTPAGLVQWAVLAPGTVTEVALPSLPEAHAEWRPTPEVPNYRLVLRTSASVSSYSDVRAHPLADYFENSGEATAVGSF